MAHHAAFLYRHEQDPDAQTCIGGGRYVMPRHEFLAKFLTFQVARLAVLVQNLNRRSKCIDDTSGKRNSGPTSVMAICSFLQNQSS